MATNRYDTKAELSETSRLIRAYFEGETTVAEERELKRRLSQTSLSTKELDEARAVMGLFAASRKRIVRRKTRRGLTQMAAAVATILVSSVVTFLLFSNRQDVPEYLAYHNGVEIYDPEAVTELMNIQLQIISEEDDVPEKAALEQINDIMAEFSID